jgi:hypothetical protein
MCKRLAKLSGNARVTLVVGVVMTARGVSVRCAWADDGA